MNTYDIKAESVFVIAEKPSAAERIAKALDEEAELKFLNGVDYWIAKRGRKIYTICAAAGHLFNIDITKGKSGIYPVLDVFWTDLEEQKYRIEAINLLSRKKDKFVIACDFDVEGDTIGYNILKYIVGANDSSMLRAKFSTLTAEEISAAFDNLSNNIQYSGAYVGRTRHLLDFIWGINTSRFLMDVNLITNKRYSPLSFGRVQGPTLNYVYKNELRRRLHVPYPYWRVEASVKYLTTHMKLTYEKTLYAEEDAKDVANKTRGKEGEVVDVIKRKVVEQPPPPFNLSNLQHESYRIFGYNPSFTLRMAENLYLKVLISYPRTNSEQLPSTLDINAVKSKLLLYTEYSEFAEMLGEKPVKGQSSDPAHPAIFPTGLHSENLNLPEKKIYDLIVRRFLASFSRPAIKHIMNIRVVNSNYCFVTSFWRTLYPGFLKIYHFIQNNTEKKNLAVDLLPKSHVSFEDVVAIEGFTQKPPQLNFSSLLRMMEQDDIGTKSTRSEIIDALYKRGYITGKKLRITDLGMRIVEIMQNFYPFMLSTNMTRELEYTLEGIKSADDMKPVLAAAVSEALDALEGLELHKTEASRNLGNIASSRFSLGPCPVCKEGNLLIIKSRSSGKRFIGCSNYKNGCHASAPLPQRGVIRFTDKACRSCGWSIIVVFFSSRSWPWRFCPNPSCPRKMRKLKDLKTAANT